MSKKITWGGGGGKRLGNVLSVAMDEGKSNTFSFRLFCPGLTHIEHAVIFLLRNYPEINIVGD